MFYAVTCWKFRNWFFILREVRMKRLPWAIEETFKPCWNCEIYGDFKSWASWIFRYDMAISYMGARECCMVVGVWWPPHHLRCLNAWFPVAGSVWGSSGGTALLEEACHGRRSWWCYSLILLSILSSLIAAYSWIFRFSDSCWGCHACPLPSGTISPNKICLP